MAGRTEKSLVVICKGGDGRLEYKGVRLSLGTGASVGDVTANADGFVARNEVMTYVVTPTELVIRSADAVVAREPMVEYGSPLAVRGPAVPPAPAGPAAALPPPPAVLVAALPPPPAVLVAQPSPAPQAPPPPQSSNPPVAGYPPLPMTARGTGNGIVRFTASRPWQLRYLVNCPANTAARGSIDAGASYMRYHAELRGDPNAPAQGTSPSRDQSGPILVSIELADQRCGWEVSA